MRRLKSDPPDQTLQLPVGVVINQWRVKPQPPPPDKSNTAALSLVLIRRIAKTH